MSWTKRGGAGAAPGPAAAQPYGTEPNMYQNYQTSNMAAPPQQPQQYWAPPAQPQAVPAYNQQYGQVYQQDYGANNANQAYPQYNQNYANQTYSQAAPQPPYQQNYYSNQAVQQQQNYGQPPVNVKQDGWEDNWDWGWEDSAKQQGLAQQQVAPPHSLPQQPPAFNNANVIEESFSSSNTWNWAMEDKKEAAAVPAPTLAAPAAQPPAPAPAPPAATPDQLSRAASATSEHNSQRSASNQSAQSAAEEVRTLNDKEIIKERLPTLALGKRFHLENLTPQWSIESQMSQESSDGVQTHSESTYLSENQSRNSNSSPVNAENYNSHSGFEVNNAEWAQHSPEELTQTDNSQTNYIQEDHEDIASSLQEMSIASRDTPSVTSAHSMHEERPVPEPAPPAAPPAVAPLPAAAPTPAVAASPAVAPPPATAPPQNAPPLLPPPPMSAPQPLPHPSTSNLNMAAGTNPFKNAGGFSHKPTSMSSAAPSPSPFVQVDDAAPPPLARLESPAAVARAQPGQQYGANLETTPDNSERPDAPPAPRRAPAPAPAPAPRAAAPPPDNLEVAPQHDRDQYLQTAHLSDYENTDFSGPAPPPGLRRMVLGQHEGAGGEGPPPGLARMVPGQTTERGYEGGYPDRRADGQPTDYGAAPRPYPAYPPPSYSPEQRVVTGGALEYPAPPAADQREGAVEGENLQDAGPAPPAPAADPAPPSRRHSAARTSGEDSERAPRRERDAGRGGERGGGRDARHPRDDRSPDRRHDRDRDRRPRDDSAERRRRRRRRAGRKYDTEDTDYYSDRERDRRRYREGSYASKPPRPEDKERRHRDERDRTRRYNTTERDGASRYNTTERDGASRYTAERDGASRYSTVERDRRYEDERDGGSRRRSDRDRDRYQRKYRDIDPGNKYGNIRKEEDERRRGDVSPPSRPHSREAPTDDDLNASASLRRRHRRRPNYDPYMELSDPYELQRRQYEYYEQLRRSDPAAYMQVYQQLMAGETPYIPPHKLYPLGYGPLSRAEESRGSVHSGRSSANGLAGKDTRSEVAARRRRDAPSVATDYSDRDLNTDASLNLQLDSSTVRSDRLTPFRFSTAHVKGSLRGTRLVLVLAAGPVDAASPVRLLDVAAALQHDPAHRQLSEYPGPLVKGVTHKKSVIEYCNARAAEASSEQRDPLGRALLWRLLALLLTQNGTVVGADIAELLMQSARDHPHQPPAPAGKHARNGRSGSSLGSERSRDRSAAASPALETNDNDAGPVEVLAPLLATSSKVQIPEEQALQQYRTLLLAGDRLQALEYAMSADLWGHALHLSLHVPRRARAATAAAFLARLAPADPLLTLYHGLGAQPPPAATCVSDARWGDWRPHAAILLANSGLRPDHEQRTLIQMGDSLMSRGLLYSAQFIYLSVGVPFSPHPLAPLSAPAPRAAPPRLALLLADSRAHKLQAFATNEAIFATEIYEYAMSLNQEFVMDDLHVYKFLLTTRLVDAGLYARALAYCERIARDVTRRPPRAAPALPARLAALADRLKYHEPQLDEDAAASGESEASPRHQWQDDIRQLADTLQNSAHSTPAHAPPAAAAAAAPAYEQYQWGETTSQYQQPAPAAPADYPSYSADQTYSYNEDWYGREDQTATQETNYNPEETSYSREEQSYAREDQSYAREDQSYAPEEQSYAKTEDQPTYGESYNQWQGESTYGYNEAPSISMPGAAPPARPSLYTDYDEPHTEERQPASTDKSKKEDAKSKEDTAKAQKGGGWLGGILTKLSLRAPNQMILPDDKNPTIVWDPETKRWKNTDGTSDEAERAPPPPPRGMPQAMPAAAAPAPGAPPAPGAAAPPAPAAGPAPPVSNIFKMQKGRHIKKSYVDVFNPGGAPNSAPPPPAELLPPAPAAAPPSYFVPAPMHHAQSGYSESTTEEAQSQWSH